MISQVLRHPRTQLPLRASACATWVAVAAVMFMVCRRGADAGMSSGIGFGTAFGLAALVTRLAFRHTRSRWQLGAFAIAAAFPLVCELVGNARLDGVAAWIAGGGGGLVGIMTARAVDHLSWRPSPDVGPRAR